MALPSFPADAPSLADGRYVLTSRIGAGESGAVYRGYDRKQRGWRAFKLLLPEVAAVAASRERFVAAAHLFASLAHPNVVRVYEVGSVQDLPFLVMELVTGGTLAAWHARHGPMPPGLAAGAALELARGLAAIHAHGGVHGSMNARNGMVTTSGVRKIGDADLGLPGGDPRVDLRGLGSMIASLVGGPAEMPPSLAEVVDQCGEALDSADAIADALERILGDLPPEPVGTPDPILDTSGSEVPLGNVRFPELDALLPAAAKAAPTPPGAVRRWVPDPSEYDDRPSYIDPEPAPAAEPPPVEVTITPPFVSPPPPPSAPAPAPAPEPASRVIIEEAVPSEAPAPLPPRAAHSQAPAAKATPAARAHTSHPPGHAPSPHPPRSRAAIPRPTAAADLSADSEPARVRSTPRLPSAGCLKLLIVPAALGGVLALLSAVGSAGVLGWSTIELRSAETETETSIRQMFRVLDNERDLVGRLVSMGADRGRLEGAYAKYLGERNDRGQLAAGLELVDEIERAALELPGNTTIEQIDLNHRVRQVHAARHQYELSMEAWGAAAGTWRGRTVIGMGLAHEPGSRRP